MGEKKTVFISYSWANRDIAERLKKEIPSSYNIWIDDAKISPGDELARRIEEGLTGSDYYLSVISEDARKSAWVRREIAFAFELSSKKKLALIPFLVADVEVPLEFRGLLFIDARKSLEEGYARVRQFFTEQATRVSSFLREAAPSGPLPTCKSILGALDLGDLRYRMADRLTVREVEVIWFDVFKNRMIDQCSITDIASACMELVDKCRRQAMLEELVNILCRNHPQLAR